MSIKNKIRDYLKNGNCDFQSRTVKNIINFDSTIKWIALVFEIGKSKNLK